VRAELGRSADPAVGVSDLTQLKRVIARSYETAYQNYDWPHLTVYADRIPLSAGQRFYDFPDNMDYDDIEKVVVWWNNLPVAIDRGIGFEEYATFDSENDATSDPVQRWDVRYTSTHEQMEVWPIPAAAGQSIQLVGQAKFVPLVNDDDLCRIDDHIVVLAAAIELTPAKERGALQAKLAAAQGRLSRLRSRSKAASGSIRVGLGSTDRLPSNRSVVRVAGR
jgi:hypothetical protein